jgi:hypothetical protein
MRRPRSRKSRTAIALLSSLALLQLGASGYDDGVDALARELEARPGNAALRAQVDRAIAALPMEPGPDLRAKFESLGLDLLRVPGLFYERYPQTGADLGAAERWLAGPVLLVETDEVGTVEGNAALVARAIERAPRPFVAISASKGSADLRAALEARPALGAKLPLWLDLVGVLEGTPLLDTRPGTDAARELGLPTATGRSLSSTVRAPAARPDRFPSDTRAVHVAAFPHIADVSPRASKGFEALRASGPNDGYVLLETYRRAPGRVLIVRGADHYLRLETLERTLAALLWVLAEELEDEDAAATR